MIPRCHNRPHEIPRDRGAQRQDGDRDRGPGGGGRRPGPRPAPASPGEHRRPLIPHDGSANARAVPHPLSAENRRAAGVAAGDQVDVDLEPDTEPREIEAPADLAQALAQDEAARAAFDRLSFTHRKEWVRWVEEAKKADTRAARIARTVQSLHDGKRAR